MRHLAGGEHLTDDAFEVLMSNWVGIYVKAPTDVLVWDLLRTLRGRGDPRLDEVIRTSAARTRWTFGAGAAHFLGELGEPFWLPLLYEFALTPGPHDHTAGNGPAVQAWVAIRAADEGRAAAAVAAEGLDDPAFGPGARRQLERIITPRRAVEPGEPAPRPGLWSRWRGRRD